MKRHLLPLNSIPLFAENVKVAKVNALITVASGHYPCERKKGKAVSQFNENCYEGHYLAARILAHTSLAIKEMHNLTNCCVAIKAI